MTRRSIALVVALLTLPILGTGRAHAHLGGALQVSMSAMTVSPAGPEQWHVVIHLVDHDSGSPAWGMDVTLKGSGPAGATLVPTRLEGDGKGIYEGHFPGPPGPWTFVVHSDPTPGGQVALTFDTTRQLVLNASGPAEGHAAAGGLAPGRHGDTNGGDGGPAGAVVMVPAAAALGALLLLGRRRVSGARRVLAGPGGQP